MSQIVDKIARPLLTVYMRLTGRWHHSSSKLRLVCSFSDGGHGGGRLGKLALGLENNYRQQWSRSSLLFKMANHWWQAFMSMSFLLMFHHNQILLHSTKTFSNSFLFILSNCFHVPAALNKNKYKYFQRTCSTPHDTHFTWLNPP